MFLEFSRSDNNSHEEEEMEESTYPVYSSFTELLDSLRDFEDEE